MSFTTQVKEDLLHIENEDYDIEYAEVLGVLRFAGEVKLGKNLGISFTCNSMGIIRRYIKILKERYELDYSVLSRTISRLDNHVVFTCEISKGADNIIKDYNLLGFEMSEFENEEQKKAFLRGAFLVRGSVNDPNSKSSHLEISYNSDTEILALQRIMNEFDLNARIAKRKNNYIVYIKSKDSIGEFLYLIGASKSMEYYQNIIITKEIKTTAKRTINLDLANQTKTNSAASEQLKNIQYIEYHFDLSKLDNKLLMVMKVRKDNVEASLSELLEIIHEEYDPYLTKSGLNHRFRKLKELVDEDLERKSKNK